MRKAFAISGVLLTLGVAAYLWASVRKDEWTTSSPEALEAFQMGLEAEMKLYRDDAVTHYWRALELDPNFAAPKVLLLEYASEHRERLLAELGMTDLEQLTARERFLVEYHLSLMADQRAKALELMARFVEAYPQDSFGLAYAARNAAEEEDTQAAEAYYRRLLELEPNWIRAQNWLGYLAMGTGRYQESEDLFKTYQYIAPDQANPHDSMAELFITLGRYDEARQELEQALALRPSFYASYRHLIFLSILQGDLDLARRVLERAREAGEFDPRLMSNLECLLGGQQALANDDWEATWNSLKDCPKDSGLVATLFHRSSLETGRWQAAQQIESSLQEALQVRQERPKAWKESLSTAIALTRGSRKLVEGHLEEARAELFQKRGLATRSVETTLLRLLLLNDLATAFERLGQSAEAAEARETIRRINPRFEDLGENLELPTSRPPAPPKTPEDVNPEDMKPEDEDMKAGST